ncbi:unnamed protein product [Caenorhabditis brenneri]
MKPIYYFFSIFLLVGVGNGLFLWEPRILSCQKSTCHLQKSEQDPPKNATCTTVTQGQTITCDIECDGAQRDSVISKKPTDFRYCNRFFTYNTQKSADGKWFIWRNGTCAEANITMTVHCAFPISGQK